MLCWDVKMTSEFFTEADSVSNVNENPDSVEVNSRILNTTSEALLQDFCFHLISGNFDEQELHHI